MWAVWACVCGRVRRRVRRIERVRERKRGPACAVWSVCVCVPWSRTDVSDVDVLRWLLCCRQVTRVVLLWVNNHFNDFETDPAMSDFLETFEKLLENQVSDAAPKWIGWHV